VLKCVDQIQRFELQSSRCVFEIMPGKRKFSYTLRENHTSHALCEKFTLFKLRYWSSGRIYRCHRCDPGSIPGWRTFTSYSSFSSIVAHLYPPLPRLVYDIHLAYPILPIYRFIVGNVSVHSNKATFEGSPSYPYVVR